MKIGKISGYGLLHSEGKWYKPESLYMTNRIYLVHKGQARCMDDGKKFILKEGHIYFIPHRPDFAPIADDGETFVHSYADFSLISPVECDKIISSKLPESEDVKLVLDVFSLVTRKKGEIRQKDSAVSANLYAMFEEAVSYLLTMLVENSGVKFVTDEVITRALYIMNRRMNEKITVSDIAAYVYMSEDGFIRKFSRIMKTTPYAYLKKLRLTTARGMINDGESVFTAALAVGYSDSAALLHALSLDK